MISIIIPVFNEEKSIRSCILSLLSQSYKDIEILVIDDGSTDKSKKILTELKNIEPKKITVLSQKHQGPGKARNLAAKEAQGDILIFVDADMTFEKDFIKNLIAPIKDNSTLGTFTKEEYVSNWENGIARAWNYNQGRKNKERVPENDPFEGSVFRAILKKEFEKVNGFDENIGYTDDWSLSRKLKYRAKIAPHAVCYHQNPASLSEVYKQARWIGKNEFISGSFIRKIGNLIRYNPIIQIPRGFLLAGKYKETAILSVCFVYSLGIQMSILESFYSKNRYL